jgi:protein-disulfide isomerase
LPEWSFPASERLVPEPAAKRHFRSKPLIAIRRTFAAALSLAGLAALAALAPLPLIGNARAEGSTAELVAKPVALPDIAVGPAKAAVTITEYASMTCPHCAAFEQNVFPMLKSKYIDTGKVRFVFREFPLDIKAAAASMLARCIANDDAEKYLATIDKLFKQQDQLVQYTKDTLEQIGAEAGMSEQAVEACVKDQALLDKLSADQKFAFEQLKVDATPTFIINGEMSKGAMSFEELDKKLKSLLKR